MGANPDGSESKEDLLHSRRQPEKNKNVAADFPRMNADKRFLNGYPRLSAIRRQISFCRFFSFPFLKISDPFVPPKPTEFDRAYLRVAVRQRWAQSRSHSLTGILKIDGRRHDLLAKREGR